MTETSPPASPSLLRTKLFAPRAGRVRVERPRLHDRVTGPLPSLVLVSAPAGFGKSTLLAHLLADESARRAVAWVSLDSGDSDPGSFWTYVLAALGAAAPGVGEAARLLHESPGGAPVSAVLTGLLNDLDAHDGEIALVLDDYHLVQSPEVHEAVAFLLEHQSAALRLVIATRSDPPLPMARLRARGELLEIRAADLRFTDDEAAAYFEAMGLRLSPEEIRTLEGRTEGWVAALQLAALSLQDRDDAATFIAGFAGDDRHVVDYLVEEVVQRQTDEVRDFLLRTSVLDRLTGALTDELTGRTDGRAVLESLDRSNLFLVPLDEQRRWYRYHHLFADMLRARLVDERPGEVSELHRRASAWFESQGDTTAAIDHSLAAGDADHAAHLVELAAPQLRKERREAQLRRWLEALPDDVFERRPVLANGYVGALMSTGEVAGVESRLRIAEEWLAAVDAAPAGSLPDGLLVADPVELRRLPGWVQIHRAGQALMTGDVAATMRHCDRAVAVLEPDDHLGHGAATALKGLASWRHGDLAAAESAYAESMRRFELAGHLADVLGCAITRAELQVVQGRLRDAERTFRDALAVGERHPAAPLRGAPDLHVGLADLHRERGDLAAAEGELRTAHDLGDHLGMPKYAHQWRLVESRIREAAGDLEGALALIDQAEPIYDRDFSPDVQPLASMRARVWARQGRHDLALAWAASRGLSAADEPDYPREHEHLTLARVLVATSDPAAIALLDRLIAAAEAGGRNGSAVEGLVLRALALQQAGDPGAAVESLGRALAHGEAEGYLRTFTSEGSAIEGLLRKASQAGASPSYVARLLHALSSPVAQPSPAGALVDPLSERELEVLRLLATELSGPDIARHLVVSLNTVRTHTKNVYAKLGVGGRRAAVLRAEELGILARRS